MAPTVRIQARSFQLSVLSRYTAYILPHTKLHVRTSASYCKNLGKILPAIRYIKMYSVYLSIYQDIRCISCSFCKLHVRNSVSYCKKSRQGASSYPLYQDTQRVSFHMPRYTLYILQILQVACERFCFLL